ncbi:hypothetical protein J2S43_006915 [Catenuloplanes nepalensis]|uniref:Uncharacterized protein n=1 Tax=Catenuloplanes nepalensis TaxID=587533 RepID=A0ABT9N3W3_9ACTN|nr:hypothetical protein [Catenuloplanes nepalensis]MDP9798403.1 hypothetical protein [Catenuloplanes nepalensis]
MPAPRTPHDAVLEAARDVIKLDCAYDAELLGTALLGSFYELADEARAEAVRAFTGDFLAATADRTAPAATTIRQIFAALVPDAKGASAVRPGPAAPTWTPLLGRVRSTGTWAYGDVYGDQTTYIAAFAYDDEALGGPEHAVVALVDHNIGIVKDVFVSGSAEKIVAQVRALCATDELTWFRDEAPERLREQVVRHLAITDELSSLPAASSLATDRALAGARLAVLPGDSVEMPGVTPMPDGARSALIADFLRSPEAESQQLDLVETEAERSSLQFGVALVVDHAATLPDADPLRWSPAVAGFFLLDWVHRRAVLDVDDAAMLPRVVRAWTAYAHRRRELPDAAVTASIAQLEDLIPEFVRLYTTGEQRSPATAAVAQLLAEGVDPQDPDALEAWLEARRQPPTED